MNDIMVVLQTSIVVSPTQGTVESSVT